MLRSWDPRLNAALRPDQWPAAARLARLKFIAVITVLLSIVAGVAAYLWYPVDRTREMAPEAIVEAAGLAILRAGYYRFHVELTGKASAYPFPDTSMAGEYQREPQVLHLKGTILSGETKVPLEYYLEQKDLFMRHPTTQIWLRLADAPLDELTAFLPDNQAAPFVGAVQKVELIGRERLPGGEALQFKLNLDAAVMLPNQPDLRDDQVDYRLWVYTSTVKPARFVATVSHQGATADVPDEGTNFTYSLVWEFDRPAKVAVPDDVRSAAQDVGDEKLPVPANDEDVKIIP